MSNPKPSLSARPPMPYWMKRKSTDAERYLDLRARLFMENERLADMQQKKSDLARGIAKSFTGPNAVDGYNLKTLTHAIPQQRAARDKTRQEVIRLEPRVELEDYAAALDDAIEGHAHYMRQLKEGGMPNATTVTLDYGVALHYLKSQIVADASQWGASQENAT